MSQFSVGQRVKVVGPARIHEGSHSCHQEWYGWGEVVSISPSNDIRVLLDHHRNGNWAIHYPPENLLDYFTAICQDAINDVSE